ncbi:MAG: hypothetical protein KIT80_19110 [Chitinophagaceae bacterium]|nr:hypothetical protein [Chitinophagaceae bacterium]MCW5929037.1 hypothetical protein [Chitinophagaceae bacterium]
MKIWFRIGLLNLVIVALYGMVMRYKIAFDFPFFDQKNLLHAHSHFAFGGWVSHFLYTGLASILLPYLEPRKKRTYNLLIAANIVCSFGMLIAFTIQGYKAVSITFSTLSIIVAAIFAWQFIKDSRQFPVGHPSKPWAITGLILNVLASAGPFSLAYMVATKSINHEIYLGSVYYYLHFQYNGWFFFGAMAIAISLLPPGAFSFKGYYRLFAITIIPTVFLSLLWARIPLWLYVITVVATLVQLGAWFALIRNTWSNLAKHMRSWQNRWVSTFFYAALAALFIKFILQAVSVIPSLSQLVFGFRPIVIAYLHLVLLGVYSLFIIGYLLKTNYIPASNVTRAAAFTFLLGVVLNEALLAIQGMAAFAYIPVPYINEMLFGAAVILCWSATWLFLLNINNKNAPLMSL